MSSNKPVLYSYWRSSCSWRVRTALAWKGIEYDYVAVNLLKTEQRSHDHTSLNPMQQVPVYKVNGVCLVQSLPIIEYIDETHPHPPLLPKDPIEKAQVRALAEMISSGIQPIQNLSVVKYVANIVGEDRRLEMPKHFISVGFSALEKALQDTAGKFCFGDHVTLPDLCLVPQVYNANRFQVDLSAFPIISRVHANLAALPAFVAAHPDNQPDCPDKQQ